MGSKFRYRGVIQDYEGNALEGAEISVYIQSPVNVQSVIDSGGITGTYYYAVQAIISDTYSKLSTEISATLDNQSITISWEPILGATYRVWRGTSSDNYTEYIDTSNNQITDDGSLTWISGSPTVTGAKVYTSEFSDVPTTSTPQLYSVNGGEYEFWVDSQDYTFQVRFIIEAEYSGSTITESNVLIIPISDEAKRLGGFEPSYFIHSILAGTLFSSYYKEVSYDNNENITQIVIYSDDTKSEQVGIISFTYDENYNITRIDCDINEQTLTITISYDAENNITNIRTSGGYIPAPYVDTNYEWASLDIENALKYGTSPPPSSHSGWIWTDSSTSPPKLRVYDGSQYVDIEVDNANKLDGQDSSYYTTAGNIDYDNSTSGLTATEVQSAIDEIDSNLDSHISNTDNPHNVIASQIDYDNSTSGLTATNIQSAVDEVNTDLNSHISDTNNPHNVIASQIDYDNSTSGLTATNIQSAVDEVNTDLNSHISNTNNPHNVIASQIDYDNSTSGLTATEVQSAIDEIDGRVDVLDTNISDHLANTNNPHNVIASQIDYDNSTSGLTATEVQSAIDELNDKVGTAIIVSNISELIEIDTSEIQNYQCFIVLGYHEPGDGGGGLFYWSSTEPKANHNGGTIIDPNITFPTNWSDTDQQDTWFTPATSGTGCWIRVISQNFVSIKWFGAKGDNNTDDTRAIKSASSHHKNIYFPKGIYIISDQLVIPKSSIWKGIASDAAPQYATDHWDTSHYGSVLAIKYGSGSTDVANSAIILNSYSVLSGVNIWYPDQPGSTTSPTQYPPAIALNPAGDSEEYNSRIIEPKIEKCVLVNPYIGIDATAEHEMLTIEDLKFTAWHTGIVIHKSYDVDRLVDVQANPTISYRGAWPDNSILDFHKTTSTMGIKIGKADQIYLDRVFCYGFYFGLVLTDMDDMGVNGIVMTQCGFEGCSWCVWAEGSFRRVMIESSMFGNSEDFDPNYALFFKKSVLDNTPDEVRLENCIIWNSTQRGIYLEKVSDVYINGCAFYDLCKDDPGYEIEGILTISCRNVNIVNTRVELSAVNENCIYFHLRDTNIARLIDCHFSNYVRSSGSCAAISEGSSHVRVVRPSFTNTTDTSVWVSGDCTDVVISDSMES